MSIEKINLTGIERRFQDDEIIVSKTDTRGRLTYVNDIFLKISDFTEAELLGQPHSIIRHPEMPRCIFKLLWETIESGKEIFAYVNNCAKNGDNYWVLAHVTPTRDANQQIVGYHSNRRVPKRSGLDIIQPLYRNLLSIENSASDRKVGANQAYKTLLDLIEKKGVAYDEFMFSL